MTQPPRFVMAAFFYIHYLQYSKNNGNYEYISKKLIKFATKKRKQIKMIYSEHFEYFYKGLKRKDYSVIYNMIQDYLWESYDEERGKIIDTTRFKSAYKLCTSVYNDLKEYEDQIEEDLKEINGEYGTPMFSYGDIPGIEDMNNICKTYHKFFEYVDLSILPDDNKINEIPPPNSQI